MLAQEHGVLSELNLPLSKFDPWNALLTPHNVVLYGIVPGDAGYCATQHLATALRGYGVSVGIRLNVFDADYYRRPVSELVREEQFDNILVCYNCLNFLTDTNLPTLK